MCVVCSGGLVLVNLTLIFQGYITSIGAIVKLSANGAIFRDMGTYFMLINQEI